DDLKVDHFNGLSDQWLAKLKNAALAGNFNSSMELVEQLPQTQKKLVPILRYLIDNFQFEAIIEKIEKYQDIRKDNS
ncbi:MAG: hypothetical protein HQL69_02675, partial [Magnetococcales bacterium]|nr:hypothetical protein [Magnetococcales bacterium]